MKNIVAQMEKCGVSRIVALGYIGMLMKTRNTDHETPGLSPEFVSRRQGTF
jgi:hypothetical protein